MLIEFTVTTRGQVHSLNAVPKGATITFVDGKECIARCEGCGKPIVEGEKYFCDPEGVHLCTSCECSLINEGIGGEDPSAEWHDEITHDMALDAEDPSLEGQRI